MRKSVRIRAGLVISSIVLAASLSTIEAYSAEMTVEQAVAYLRDAQMSAVSMAYARTEINPITNQPETVSSGAGLNMASVDIQARSMQSLLNLQVANLTVDPKVVAEAAVLLRLEVRGAGLAAYAKEFPDNATAQRAAIAQQVSQEVLAAMGVAQGGQYNSASSNDVATVANAMLAALPGLTAREALGNLSATSAAPGAFVMDNGNGNPAAVIISVKGEVLPVMGGEQALSMSMNLQNQMRSQNMQDSSGLAKSLEPERLPPGQTLAQVITDMVNSGAAEGNIGAYARAINADPKVVAMTLLAAGVPAERVVSELTAPGSMNIMVDATGNVRMISGTGSSTQTDAQVQTYVQTIIDTVVAATPSYSYSNAVAAAVSAGADPSKITPATAAGNTTVQTQQTQSGGNQNQSIAARESINSGSGIGSQTPSSVGAGTGVSRS